MNSELILDGLLSISALSQEKLKAELAKNPNFSIHNEKVKIQGSERIIRRLVFVGDPSIKYSIVGWVLNIDVSSCMVCSAPFTLFRRRHHCTACGNVVCASCSPNRVTVVELMHSKEYKICSQCYFGQHEVRVFQPSTAVDRRQVDPAAITDPAEHRSSSAAAEDALRLLQERERVDAEAALAAVAAALRAEEQAEEAELLRLVAEQEQREQAEAAVIAAAAVAEVARLRREAEEERELAEKEAALAAAAAADRALREAEEAELLRLVAEQEERERIEAEIVAQALLERQREKNAAAEEAERERVAAEEAERERVAAEEAEREREAAEEAERERVAAEEAERERVASEEAIRWRKEEQTRERTEAELFEIEAQRALEEQLLAEEAGRRRLAELARRQEEDEGEEEDEERSGDALAPPAVKVGWLSKRGHNVLLSWKRRYFVLSGGKFVHYEKPSDTEPFGIDQRGAFDLTGMTVSVDKTVPFGLYLTNGGKYDMAVEASSTGERDEWKASLEAHIHFATANATRISAEDAPGGRFGRTWSINTEENFLGADGLGKTVSPLTRQRSVDNSAPPVIKKVGYLNKKGHNLLGAWKTRYFVLSEGVLQHADKPSDEPRGDFNLAGMSVRACDEKGHPFSLLVTDDSDKANHLLLEAANKDEQLAWLASLEAHINFANNKPTAAAGSRPASKRGTIFGRGR